MKPKYIITIILAILAAGAGYIYISRQPVEDLGPITVHRQPKQASSNPSPEFMAGGKLGLPFSLKIGGSEDISAENLNIKLVSVNDSRCPAEPNIQCIWAGTVLAKVELFQNSKSLGRTDVEIGKKNTVGNYEIEFRKVLPAKKAVNQADADYVLTFQISKI